MSNFSILTVVLLATFLQLAKSLGLNFDELRKTANNIGITEQPISLNRINFTSLSKEIFKFPRDSKTIEDTFKAMQESGYVSENKFKYHCEAVGHLLKDNYFERPTWELNEEEIYKLYRFYIGNGDKSIFKFQDLAMMLYGFENLCDSSLPLSENQGNMINRFQAWYATLKSDGVLTIEKILDLCKNTANLLDKEYIKNNK